MTQTIENMIAAATHLKVRALTHDDTDALYTLQQANQAVYDLFLDHHLTKREALMDLDAIPLQSAEGQKHYLGFFVDDQLVASLDLMVDYPLPQVAWIGQYFWQPDLVDNAQAKDWLKSVFAVLQTVETVQVQLMVLKRDLTGQQFYEDLGFICVQETVADVFSRNVSVVVYQDEIRERHK